MRDITKIDFITNKERLYNLGCRSVNTIKKYSNYYESINKKRLFVKSVLIPPNKLFLGETKCKKI